MHKALHTLKLVLPQPPRVQRERYSGQNLHSYVWPCGCVANGHDEAALDVRCCVTHVDLLAEAPPTRTLPPARPLV